MDKAMVVNALKQRLAEVNRRLAAACKRAGRDRSTVAMVAVTKTVSVELAALLPDLGILDLGENRPQELWRKAAALPKAVRWHLIGHLQRNKVAATLPLVAMIHAVDSFRLLETLEAEAAKRDTPVNVLLQVNLSGEASKHGFGRDDTRALASAVEKLDPQQIRLMGLMTMAPLQAAESCRPIFAGLRRLRDELRAQSAPRQPLMHLSMGMSNDFEVAVEEGATLVRLGSVLFEGLRR